MISFTEDPTTKFNRKPSLSDKDDSNKSTHITPHYIFIPGI